MKKKICFLMAVVLFAVLGCASFLSSSYKGEYVSGSVYNVGMATISSLQKSGTITDEVRAKVNAKAIIFYNSYQVSVDALATYFNVKDATTQQMVNTTIASLFSNWSDLAALINSIAPNTVPTTYMKIKGAAKYGGEYSVTVKQLDAGTISVIIQIGAAIIQFVLPEIQNVVNVLGQNTVTLDQIQALKTLIKPPTEY
jgi:hypothetical protein